MLSKRNIFTYSAWALIAAAGALLAVRAVLGEQLRETPPGFKAPAGQALAPGVESFDFIAVADTGSENLTLQSILKPAIRQERPAFILHLGDLSLYRSKAQFNWLLAEVAPKLHSVPFYITPGNHDIHTDKDSAVFKEVFGETSYWFSYGDVLFISLDSSRRRIDSGQYAWLAEVLADIRPRYKYCVVYTHIPPEQIARTDGHALSAGESAKLEEALEGKGVDLMLFGHEHEFIAAEFAGAKAYVLPSSGQDSRAENRDNRRFGYLRVEAGPGSRGLEVGLRYSEAAQESEFIEIFMVNLLFGKRFAYLLSALVLLAAGCFAANGRGDRT